MSIIVQKFGGTSVADAEKIRRAARRVIKTKENGYQVVVVASARGKQTDQLVADALEINPNPPKREMDQWHWQQWATRQSALPAAKSGC
jgi:aspartate kinase